MIIKKKLFILSINKNKYFKQYRFSYLGVSWEYEKFIFFICNKHNYSPWRDS